MVALPGVGPVTLSKDRCPAFRQLLRDHVGAVSSSEHLLNCAAVPPITTRGVRFDMRVPVPAKVPGYDLSLDWLTKSRE